MAFGRSTGSTGVTLAVFTAIASALLTAPVPAAGQSPDEPNRRTDVPAPQSDPVVLRKGLSERYVEHDAVQLLLAARPDLRDFELALVRWRADSLVGTSYVHAIPFVVTPARERPFLFLLLLDARTESQPRLSYRMISQQQWFEAWAAMADASGLGMSSTPQGMPVYDRKSTRELRTGQPGQIVQPVSLVPISQLGSITRRGIQYFDGDQCYTAPFTDVGADRYVVAPVQGVGDWVYSQRTVSIFLRESSLLVELGFAAMNDIHQQLVPEYNACNPEPAEAPD